MSSADEPPVQACPSCGRVVDTSGLEPFGKISCPGCGVQMRVERAFENYEIVEPLGTGGMGSVFKARDTNLNRFVALKLLRREFAGDRSFTEKLMEEARITGSIQHPHVVEVYSVGEEHGQFYVVMELVDGGSLDDKIEDEKSISEVRVLEIGLQVAKGLQAALQAGLIHRDIKPGNILFSDPSNAKIVDFGLALLAAKNAAVDGEIWGTPYYVAPERLSGQPEDFRGDLYSLGATLFHAVAGRPTFAEETQAAAELKVLKAHPPRLQEIAPHVSDETSAVIDKMLRPDPADRQATYEELIDELSAARAAAVAREEEARARWSTPVRALVMLGCLALLGAVGYGVFIGLHHLPDWRSHLRLPNERIASDVSAATPVVELTTQVPPAMRELQAGHYEASEALFRQIAESAPSAQPMVDLCAALQLWEQGDFTQAATALRQFVAFKAPPKFSWMNDAKPLATDRLADYQRYEDWQKARSTSNDPETLLKKIDAVTGQLKTKGALAFQLADEKAKLVAQVAEVSAKRADEDKARAAAERPKWALALADARKADAAYRFEEAVAALQRVPLTSASLQAERDRELQRARWLLDWRNKLLSDINRTGFGGKVTDIHGVLYDGPVRRATARQFELKTRYGSVMTDWLNLSPKMLLTMSRAFIRPGASDLAEREWLSALFAQETGQVEAARAFAQKAAEAKAEFAHLLPLYFPDAKK